MVRKETPLGKNAYGLQNINLLTEYNTEENDVIDELYAPCLKTSIKYERAVGYFRANIYRELGEDLLNFVINGGRVKIVCSPDISEKDEEAAREGYALRGKRSDEDISQSLTNVIKAMSSNPLEADCLDMLRLLIEKGSLELFVAISHGGIYHRKIGAFYDKFDNVVVFSGSGNETRNAISSIEDWSNDEDFDVYRSWGSEFEIKKALSKLAHLNKMFCGGTAKTIVRPINEIEKEALQKFRKHAYFEDCRSGARQRSSSDFSERNKPSTIVPYYYQTQAIDAWKKASSIGIFEMATGTGKTYTALFAIREYLEEGHPILIVVPSTILMEQWKKNINAVYSGTPILFVGAGHDWKNEPTKRLFVIDLKKPRIILATMQTASSKEFIDFFNQAKNSILIADEVHRLGSPEYRKIFQLKFKATLGLSATPERVFDPDGSDAIKKVFGESPIFSLPLAGSILLHEGDIKRVPVLGHFLCKYYYFFERVYLLPQEMDQWLKITQEIKKVAARSNYKKGEGEKTDLPEKLKYLFIDRSKIVKKAANKIKTVCKIIEERYPPEGRWIVYCEDEQQLNSISQELIIRQPNYVVLKYHSQMSSDDREKVLRYFERNPSILVSIRCLDEGVDVPSADGAIIVASSSNPREYIQRRGRVLRKALGKKNATIIDVIVDPRTTDLEGDVPFSIIRSEIGRAWEFAKNAENSEITHELWKLCQEYNVDMVIDSELGLEETENGD